MKTVDNTDSTVSTLYSYNLTGDVQSVTDEAGKVTDYSYDSIGRIKQISYNDGTKQTVQYDDELYSVKSTAQME